MYIYWTPSIYILIFPMHLSILLNQFEGRTEGDNLSFPRLNSCLFLFFSPTSFLFIAVTVWLISLWGIIFAFLLICLTRISVGPRGESKSIYLLKSTSALKIQVWCEWETIWKKGKIRSFGEKIPPIAAHFLLCYIEMPHHSRYAG